MNSRTFWTRVESQIGAIAITHADAANACGVNNETYFGWMYSGNIPPFSCTDKLACFLGVSLDYLIYGINNDKTAGLLKKATEILENIQCFA